MVDASNLTPDVRSSAAEAARKVDRDYGHWQDWVGSIDEFQHERALSTVDAVTAVVAPQIARQLQAELDQALKLLHGREMQLQIARNDFDALTYNTGEIVRERDALHARVEELEAALTRLLAAADNGGYFEDVQSARASARAVLAKREKP